VLWIVTVLIVVLATVPAAAHALELPGKMRLSKDEYAVMQRVYYPGFTVAGLAEPAAILMTLILLIRAPVDHMKWFILALTGIVSIQVIYWLVTHPVNKVWIEGQRLGAASGRFFSARLGPRRESGVARSPKPMGVFACGTRWVFGFEPGRVAHRWL
jgi:hypothetical protein